MTTNYYENFGIPVEVEGEYEEILNTDKDIYGGDNQYNGLPIGSFGGYVTIKLASMGALILKLKKNEPVVEEPVKEEKKTRKSSRAGTKAS